MRVDAHQHFWRLSRGDYRWLTPALARIHRDFSPRDLAPLLARHGIERTIAVQAADSVAETRYLLELARENSFVAGVVGWIDFEAADAVSVLEELSRDPKLRGVRPMIQDIPDPDWMLREAFTPVFRAIVDLDLAFDALVLPAHLDNLLTLLRRHPDLRVVIDHGAKPRIRDRVFEPWAADMTKLATETAAQCKLSGLVTEARADWKVADLRPYVDHLLSTFGPSRMIWGSDWPVLELAGDYDRWVEATHDLLAGLSERDRAAILGDNACDFYRIRE